jgi:hypothetical protein
MTHVVIFKLGHSLKSDFADRPLSVIEKHILFFCTQYDQIYLQISQHKADLIYYFVDELSSADINHLKKIDFNYPECKIILCAPSQYALLAWKHNVFHFDEQPIEMDQVKRAFAKYIRSKESQVNNTLSIKLPDGVYNIPFKDLRYLLASGNYTFVHYESDKQLVITKQLGQFDFLTEKNEQFRRVHRSLIINISLVKEVNEHSISFFGMTKSLSISASLSVKIKKLIIL